MASPELLAAVSRLLSSGAWHQAETAARAAIATDLADPQAALLLAGFAVAAMGEAARAAPILAQVAAARPDGDHPCVDLARLRPPFTTGCSKSPPNDQKRLGALTKLEMSRLWKPPLPPNVMCG